MLVVVTICFSTHPLAQTMKMKRHCHYLSCCTFVSCDTSIHTATDPTIKLSSSPILFASFGRASSPLRHPPTHPANSQIGHMTTIPYHNPSQQISISELSYKSPRALPLSPKHETSDDPTQPAHGPPKPRYHSFRPTQIQQHASAHGS
jgi:hypothetical protein